eukprot:5763920-Prymnesium_polylepis.1
MKTLNKEAAEETAAKKVAEHSSTEQGMVVVVQTDLATLLNTRCAIPAAPTARHRQIVPATFAAAALCVGAALTALPVAMWGQAHARRRQV